VTSALTRSFERKGNQGNYPFDLVPVWTGLNKKALSPAANSRVAIFRVRAKRQLPDPVILSAAKVCDCSRWQVYTIGAVWREWRGRLKDLGRYSETKGRIRTKGASKRLRFGCAKDSGIHERRGARKRPQGRSSLDFYAGGATIPILPDKDIKRSLSGGSAPTCGRLFGSR